MAAFHMKTINLFLELIIMRFECSLYAFDFSLNIRIELHSKREINYSFERKMH